METLVKTTWAIDPTHSEVGFKVRHLMLSTVTGYFETFEATADTEGDDFTHADIQVSVDTASIRTKDPDRDAHLRSDDFFNAEQFPRMSFRSTSFDGSKLEGELTIRDITRKVSFDVEFNGVATDPYGQTKAGFEISGEINRKDFGLNWSAVTEAGNIVVSDKVKLVIDAQFIRQD